MAKVRVSVEVRGGPELAAALAGVKAGVANRVMKAAGRKQAAKAAKVAKAHLRGQRTGQLKRSIGAVYRAYRKSKVWVFVVGPRKGFRTQVAAVPKSARNRLIRVLGKQRGRTVSGRQVHRIVGKYVDPVKYAHLVEGGRKAVSPVKAKVLADGAFVYGKRVWAVPPRPFMAPAGAAVAGSGSEMVADVNAGIAREAAKYAAKGKSILRG